MASSRLIVSSSNFKSWGRSSLETTGFFRSLAASNPFTEEGRESSRAGDDAIGMIPRYIRTVITRGSRLHGLFDINEAIELIDTEQNCIPQATERTATFHPVSGVEYFNGVVFASSAQTRN